MSETGAEVRVHRTLLGLYTDQWRQNLQALDSTELVFLLQGVGHLELEELLADIYKPLLVTEDDGDKEDTNEQNDKTVDENTEGLDISINTSELNRDERINVKVDPKYIDIDDQDEDYSCPTGVTDIVTEDQEIFKDSFSQDDFIEEESEEKTEALDVRLKTLEYKEKMKKVTDGNRTRFICLLCDSEYKKEMSARSHIESKHFGLKYPCKECNMVLVSISSYAFHQSEKHRRDPLVMKECDYCDYSTQDKKCLERHISRTHLNEKVECEKCHKKYKKENLKEHLKLVHGPKTECCDVCSQFVSDIKIHKRKIHKEKICQICNMSLSGERSYSIHNTKFHKESKDQKERSVFKCSSCDYTTHKKELLNRHDLINHNINYIYCDQCEYKTKLETHLREHQRKKHDNNFQKYKCDQCDYKCIRSDYLRRHVESLHEKVRYHCDQCGYQATRMQYLKKHYKTIHNLN